MEVILNLKNGSSINCSQLDNLEEWGKILKVDTPIIINENILIRTNDIESVETTPPKKLS